MADVRRDELPALVARAALGAAALLAARVAPGPRRGRVGLVTYGALLPVSSWNRDIP
ncbi:hypothetical protein ACFQL0_04525 [Haloplanus litoreus]|uniref:hypothetical protein n=1 Tax=Haloplanus litoreus TaxID=767515 RepID=UPI00361C836B